MKLYHKWILSDQPITEQDDSDMVIARHICSVCTCHRTTQLFTGIPELEIEDELLYTYYRNDIHFDIEPECIDWKEENLKEID